MACDSSFPFTTIVDPVDQVRRVVSAFVQLYPALLKFFSQVMGSYTGGGMSLVDA